MDRSSDASRPNLQLTLGTVSFAICFAAWGLISAFAPRFREAFHLTATQTAFLVAVPVLLGALLRIATGMLADRFGGRAIFSLLLIIVAVLTRATVRRVAGALAGGTVSGAVALGIIALGEEVRWWHMAITLRSRRA